MAASYVLVTAAALVLVEAVVLGVLLPRILATSARSSQAAAVVQEAWSDVKPLAQRVAEIAAQSRPATSANALVKLLAHDPELGVLGLAGPGGKARAGANCVAAANIQALIATDGRVLSSSDPARCPQGVWLSFAIRRGLAGQGTAAAGRGEIVWAVRPIVYHTGTAPRGVPSSQPSASTSAGVSGPIGKGSPAKVAQPGKLPPRQGQILGEVYAAEPAGAAGVSFAQVRTLLVTGAVVLALLLPAGTVFGLLSTRRVIRRIKRLAAVTTTVAGGDFRPRVEVSSHDEIGQLEDAFNRMTGRLSAAVDAERVRAGAEARQTERARIARELHDSISQDLFSLSLLAAGLRKALHGNPLLRPEVTAMERTSARAMREMHALLLELRPVALEDSGLVPAVTELCQAYQARLAINVCADLGEVSLGPAAEHAVLRIIQEALGNAARHGEPETITVRLSQLDGFVTVEIRDDGRGFDPADVSARHGMGLALMRERVTELGGSFQLDSAMGDGAAITVQLPAGQDGQT